jgi:hypothetical protein
VSHDFTEFTNLLRFGLRALGIRPYTLKHANQGYVLFIDPTLTSQSITTQEITDTKVEAYRSIYLKC